MSVLTWSDSYLVGNDALDNQHMNLFLIISHLEQLLISGKKDRARSKELLDKFLQTALAHFECEERLMSEFLPDELIAHREQHKKYHLYFEAQLALLDEGKINIEQFFESAQKWWVGHVSQEDKKYKGFIPKLAK